MIILSVSQWFNSYSPSMNWRSFCFSDVRSKSRPTHVTLSAFQDDNVGARWFPEMSGAIILAHLLLIKVVSLKNQLEPRIYGTIFPRVPQQRNALLIGQSSRGEGRRVGLPQCVGRGWTFSNCGMFKTEKRNRCPPEFPSKVRNIPSYLRGRSRVIIPGESAFQGQVGWVEGRIVKSNGTQSNR